MEMRYNPRIHNEIYKKVDEREIRDTKMQIQRFRQKTIERFRNVEEYLRHRFDREKRSLSKEEVDEQLEEYMHDIRIRFIGLLTQGYDEQLALNKIEESIIRVDYKSLTDRIETLDKDRRDKLVLALKILIKKEGFIRATQILEEQIKKLDAESKEAETEGKKSIINEKKPSTLIYDELKKKFGRDAINNMLLRKDAAFEFLDSLLKLYPGKEDDIYGFVDLLERDEKRDEKRSKTISRKDELFSKLREDQKRAIFYAFISKDRLNSGFSIEAIAGIGFSKTKVNKGEIKKIVDDLVSENQEGYFYFGPGGYKLGKKGIAQCNELIRQTRV